MSRVHALVLDHEAREDPADDVEVLDDLHAPGELDTAELGVGVAALHEHRDPRVAFHVAHLLRRSVGAHPEHAVVVDDEPHADRVRVAVGTDRHQDRRPPLAEVGVDLVVGHRDRRALVGHAAILPIVGRERTAAPPPAPCTRPQVSGRCRPEGPPGPRAAARRPGRRPRRRRRAGAARPRRPVGRSTARSAVSRGPSAPSWTSAALPADERSPRSTTRSPGTRHPAQVSIRPHCLLHSHGTGSNDGPVAPDPSSAATATAGPAMASCQCSEVTRPAQPRRPTGRAVADRDDARRRAQPLVHLDAAADVESHAGGPCQPAGRRAHPDAHEDRVRCQRAPVVEGRAHTAPGRPHRGHRAAETQGHPGLPPPGRRHGREVGWEGGRQRRVLRVHRRHVGTGRGRGGRDLGPDPAGTHQEHPCPRHERLPQRRGVVPGAQHPHAGDAGPAVGDTGSGPARDHEAVVPQVAAVPQPDRAGSGVQPHRARGRAPVDVVGQDG